jgi:hypothetical protein
MNAISPIGPGGQQDNRSKISTPLDPSAQLLRRALSALVLSVLVVFVLSTGVARAAAPGVVPDGRFELEVPPAGVAVDNSCFVQGLSGGACSATDPSNDDVYTGGFLYIPKTEGLLLGSVNKFDASGHLLSPPSPFGGGVYSGAAVNPTNGAVYVLGQSSFGEPFVVGTYDPGTGAPVGPPFSVPESGNYFYFAPWTVVQIAADSAGNVYVPVVPENKVLEYDPATCPAVPEPCVPLHTFTGGSGAGALKGPTGVAVDASGNLWVADAGNNRVEEVSPANTPVREIQSEGVQAVALDVHGDVFATVTNSADSCGALQPPCSHLLEYSPTGAQLADVGAGSIGERAVHERSGEVSPLPNMLAVSDSSGHVYVTEGVVDVEKYGNSRVFIFAPPVAPRVESELAVEVGASDAKLGARVNPGGLDAAYRFEFGTTTAYGRSVPFPEGDSGAGFSSRTVWAAAHGLAPGATYHYRVVVTSGLGEAVGVDRTFTTATPAQVACPNERFRTAFSAGLPDCRAWELVTPPNKNGAQPDPFHHPGDVEGALKTNFAAADGGRMGFLAENILPGSASAGEQYVATRAAGGWLAENEIPPQNYYGFECPNKNDFLRAYSADLSKVLLAIGGNPSCGGPDPEVVPGQPKGVQNLFVRDNTNGSYQLVDITPPGVTPAPIGGEKQVVSASADLSHVVFSDEAKLTANALEGVENLYEWTGGAVRLVTVLDDGTPVPGSFTGISADGSRIFFRYEGRLYARVNGSGAVQIDAPQGGAGGGGGAFAGASADGSQVLFTDASELINGSASGTSDLYRYDFAAPEGQRLADLTVHAGEPASVNGVAGVSEDGSRVYFTAKGVLTGSEENAHGEKAVSGQGNLYLSHGGTITFITHSNGAERLSKNGAFLAFESRVSLTGYDNINVNTGNADPEIYLYDAAHNSIACASCNPSAEPPTGSTSDPAGGAQLGGRPSPVSENGRVFFNSNDALLPADTNDQTDVYEFELDGVGGCHEAAGCVFLLSTGTSSLGTYFIDASASGNDVFLREYQQLLPQDRQEEAAKIYDARVNGGLPAPAAPAPCTTADACRSAPELQPGFPSGGVGTAAVFGEDNLSAPAVKPAVEPKRCRKGFVKRKGRCVKAKRGKRARGSTARRAGNKRGARS